MADIFEISGRIHSTSQEEVVTTSSEILDEEQNKKQSEVNADVDTALADRYTKEETYSKSQLDNLITTPDVQYVTVATYSALPATGEADTIYRVASWDGTAVDAGKYSEYAWNGSAYQLLAVRSGSLDGVFDISQANASGGDPATYDNLAAAISGTNVPEGVKAGGMSVKYIENVYADYGVVVTEGLETQPTGTALQSAPSITDGVYKASQLSAFAPLPSTIGASNTYYIAVTVDETTTYTKWVVTKINDDAEKYVQYRLIASEWSTDVSFWQGVDDVPKEGSINLVESKDVARLNKTLDMDENPIYEMARLSVKDYQQQTGYFASNGTITSTTGANYIVFIPLKKWETLSYNVMTLATNRGFLGKYDAALNKCTTVYQMGTNAAATGSFTATETMTLAVGFSISTEPKFYKNQFVTKGSNRLNVIEENAHDAKSALNISKSTIEEWANIPVTVISGYGMKNNGPAINGIYSYTDWVFLKKGTRIKVKAENALTNGITIAVKSVYIDSPYIYSLASGAVNTELTLQDDGYYSITYKSADGYTFQRYGHEEIHSLVSNIPVHKEDDMSEDCVEGQYVVRDGSVTSNVVMRYKTYKLRAGERIYGRVIGYATNSSILAELRQPREVGKTQFIPIQQSASSNYNSFDYTSQNGGIYAVSTSIGGNAYVNIDGNSIESNIKEIAQLKNNIPEKESAALIQNMELGHMFRKIAVIGDSMSCGTLRVRGESTDRDSFGASWLSMLALRWNCDGKFHYARGGSSCYQWLNSNGSQSFGIGRFKADVAQDKIFNAYFIAYGHNDGADVGQATDTPATIVENEGTWSVASDLTFCSYYKAIIELVRAAAPHAMIFLLSEYDSYMITNKPAYSQAVKDIADYYYNQGDQLIHHLDTGGVPFEGMVLDVHYSTIGYNYIAMRVNEEANKVLWEYMSDEELKYFGAYNTNQTADSPLE